MTYLLSDLQNFLWPAPPSAATILVIDVDEHGGSKLLCNLNLGPVETSIPSIGPPVTDLTPSRAPRSLMTHRLQL